MAPTREKKREFRLEPSEHQNGHWRLAIGSYRNGKPATVFLLSDGEVDNLGELLLEAETTGRALGVRDAILGGSE